VFDAAEHAVDENVETTEPSGNVPLDLATADPAEADAPPDDDWPASEPLDADDALDLPGLMPGDVEADTDPVIHIPADLPDLEPAAYEAPSAEQALESPPAHPRTLHPAAVLAALLLITAALGQLAWHYRDQVLATPIGQMLGEKLCGLADCKLPPQRAPSRFVLLERNIAPAPDRDGVLAMQLSFRNDAGFAQPLPDIQLSLYDSEQRLMARRRLHPEEYLFPAPASGFLVASGEQVRVNLQLEDPGRKAVGFRLEFL
jgi:hypothetical protein